MKSILVFLKFPLIPLPIKEAVLTGSQSKTGMGVSINSTSYKGSGDNDPFAVDGMNFTVSINSTSYKGSGNKDFDAMNRSNYVSINSTSYKGSGYV